MPPVPDAKPSHRRGAASGKAALKLSGWLSPTQLYVLSALALVLGTGRYFYSGLHAQTEQVELWFRPELFESFAHGERESRWSAPLDDVFIHFDFARAIARGFPFEWSEGNGYSSGGTSLLYPFVLALGYWAGFRDLLLMHWAAIVAHVCVFGMLLGSARLFSKLPAHYALLLPPILLSVGGLNWSLYSGMEGALFLALWALTFVLWDDLSSAVASKQGTKGGALALGAAAALLVASRPEAAPLVALFAFTATWPLWKGRQWSSAFTGLLLIGSPGAAIVVGQLIANRLLTGDYTAAGGLAKLEVHHPYMTRDAMFEAWWSYVRYQIERLSIHHFSAVPGLGFVLWPLGLLALWHKETRRYAALLWITILFWTAFVGLNGQVRWQNERYAMPTAAWLLMTVGLGVAGSIHRAIERSQRTPLSVFAALGSSLAVAVFFVTQAPRYADQAWFFGRASRNILEQHIRSAEFLRYGKRPTPSRVLVSDAGAIPYIADLPAFDLIGLGGYGGYPIARASRQGVGAAVELIEHMPARGRPDIFALYPGWWGNFVLWFGRPIYDFPVRGNVICGGQDMVIYEPNWTPLDHSAEPLALGPGERVVDELDVADLISEKAHDAELNEKAVGFVDMKMLADPRSPRHDLWDAGRVFTGALRMKFRLSGFRGTGRALLVRVAPPSDTQIIIESTAGAPVSTKVRASDSWQEVRLPLSGASEEMELRLGVSEGATILYHVFAVESP